MASATGIPDQSYATEQEPLLGRPGDAAQGDEPIYRNLVIGKTSSRAKSATTEAQDTIRNRRRRAGRSMDSSSNRMGSNLLP